MTPERDERFRRIAEDYLERPGGDYAELLRRGQVSSPEGVDPEQWRAAIRAKARADKIRVITIRSGERAMAARQRRIPKDREFAELTAALERGEVLRGVAERARRRCLRPGFGGGAVASGPGRPIVGTAGGLAGGTVGGDTFRRHPARAAFVTPHAPVSRR